jgi:hypothetical protein
MIAAVLGLLVSCGKSGPSGHLVIEVPAGYSGTVTVQLGVVGARPLRKEGDIYVIAVPADGRVATSTTLSEGVPTFKNVSGDRVWGYATVVLRTGDGIPVGGSIEFFVGTKDQYQVEVARKHKSSIDPLDGVNVLSASLMMLPMR